MHLSAGDLLRAHMKSGTEDGQHGGQHDKERPDCAVAGAEDSGVHCLPTACTVCQCLALLVCKSDRRPAGR